MKKALVVVDFQNDFVTGSLGFDKAVLLRPIIVDKIEKALLGGIDVIFTMDTHNEDYLETLEGKRLPIKHCIKGSWGWNLDDSVSIYKDKAVKVIEKPAFGSPKLGEFLKEKEYEEVELCGLVTSICVLSNAIIAKAFLPQAKVVVDARATEDASQDAKHYALECMKCVMVDVI